MEPTSSQHDSSDNMSQWDVLVQVASQRYEELLDEENRQKELQKQETATAQSEANQQQPTDQTSTLTRSAEISVAENVTVDSDGDEENDDGLGRLVIVDVPMAEEEVDQVVPSTNGIRETEQCLQQQRETVIQCRSNGLSSELGHNSAAVPSQESRTPEQQAVRERNTIAARQSRAKMRVRDDMLQQEADNESAINKSLKWRVAGMMTYVKVLRDHLGLDQTDLLEDFERVKHLYLPGPSGPHNAGNRTHPGQENGDCSQPGPSGTNGQAAYPRESEVTLTEKSFDIANGSETDSAPEPDDTVLDLSVRSK